MTPARSRTKLLGLLLAAALAICTNTRAADVDSLQLIVAELPYPQMTFGVSVGFQIGDVSLLHIGDPVQARQQAEQQLAVDPDDPQAHLLRAMALDRLDEAGARDEYARAAELWRQALAAQPGDLAARLGLAQALFEGGSEIEAMPLVRELAEQHADLWWPQFAMGQHSATAIWSLVGMGFTGGSEDFPNLSDPAAVAAWTQEFPADLAASINEALSKAQEDPERFRALLTQLADNARQHLELAAQAAPEEVAPRLLLALVQVQTAMFGLIGEEGGGPQVLDAAIEGLRRLADERADLPRLRVFAHFMRVAVAMAEARVDDFMDVWQRFPPESQQAMAADESATAELLSAESGRISDTYELLAVYAMLHGNQREALARLTDSVDRDPADAERWEAYIGVLTQTEGLDSVQQAIERALAHVDNGTLRCALAKVYQKRGELALAETELQKAIAHADERRTFAQVMLGVIRLKSGDAAGAVEPLQSAAAEWTQDGLCEAALALALALTGKDAEAAEHIARAVELSPEVRIYARARDMIAD